MTEAWLWMRWASASGVLWPLGVAAGLAFGPATVTVAEGVVFWTLFYIVVGTSTAALQSLVLGPYRVSGVRWVAATCVGWAIGTPPAWLITTHDLPDFVYYIVGDAAIADSLVFWLVAGGCVSVSQWLVLRRSLPDSRAWVWLGLLAWPVAGLVGRLVTGQLTGLIFGGISGVWLAWMLPAAVDKHTALVSSARRKDLL